MAGVQESFAASVEARDPATRRDESLYSAAIAEYEKRSDTEHLADRRARDIASEAAEQDFTRTTAYDGMSGETSDSGFPDAVVEPDDTDYPDTEVPGTEPTP